MTVFVVVYVVVVVAFAGHALLDRAEHNYSVAPPLWHELIAAALWPIIVPSAWVYRTWRRVTDPTCIRCGGRLGRKRWKDVPKYNRICSNGVLDEVRA